MLTDVGVIAAPSAPAGTSKPIQLHPDNPHYFLWRDKPTILITSTEHYGAVLNKNFDYAKYLDKLNSLGFNLTRTFSGAYCEPPAAFNIQYNTLAPAKGALLCPWARSDTPGYPNGGNKFDLIKWNQAYFDRLKDFLIQAGKRGIVVELVLFCPFYEDSMWLLSPMNARNNVNGIGTCPRTEVYTLKYPDLLAVQQAMVRKVVEELRGFDNLYYEICNEPYFGGVTLDWQAAIATTILETETKLGIRHLIAQNIANNHAKITDPNPNVSIFNFHYAKPQAAADNYGLNQALGDDETGFAGSEPKPYRIEGWKFILSGGAVYDNLDYSFTVGHEDGTADNKAPGGGGSVLHRQLGILKDFVNSLSFVRMKPDNSVIKGALGKNITAYPLVDPGRAYAIYISGDGCDHLTVGLPAGSYRTEWLNTKTGQIDKAEPLDHKGGDVKLPAPAYQDDIALRIMRAD
jgi:hypothetical protein